MANPEIVRRILMEQKIKDDALKRMADTLRLLLQNTVISPNTLDVGAFPSPVVPNVILHEENLKVWADKLLEIVEG